MTRLVRYGEEDLDLTLALETDPAVMTHLGGPRPRPAILDAHRRRVETEWWLKIVDDSGRAAGTIGIWASARDGRTLHETGWMLLPAFQGRGLAGRALRLLLARARSEPAFAELHAFPGVDNAPSNALCRSAGFELVGTTGVEFSGRPLRVNHWRIDVGG